jgi:hypothetical protein
VTAEIWALALVFLRNSRARDSMKFNMSEEYVYPHLERISESYDYLSDPWTPRTTESFQHWTNDGQSRMSRMNPQRRWPLVGLEEIIRWSPRLPSAHPQARRACNGNLGMGRLTFSDTSD